MSSVICVLVNCFNCITVHCNRLRFVNQILSINENIINAIPGSSSHLHFCHLANECCSSHTWDDSSLDAASSANYRRPCQSGATCTAIALPIALDATQL